MFRSLSRRIPSLRAQRSNPAVRAHERGSLRFARDDGEGFAPGALMRSAFAHSNSRLRASRVRKWAKLRCMDWDNVRVFLAVARAGQFVAGARRLHLDHAT